MKVKHNLENTGVKNHQIYLFCISQSSASTRTSLAKNPKTRLLQFNLVQKGRLNGKTGRRRKTVLLFHTLALETSNITVW